MKNILIILCAVISVSSFAKSFKIKSSYEEETQYINVNETDKEISFQFCDSRLNECEFIGAKQFYSKISLSEKKHNEYAKSVVTVIGDLALGGGVAAATAYFFGAVIAMNFEMTAMGLATVGGAVGGFTIAELTLMSMDALNPMNHYASGKLLSMATDKDTSVQDIISFKRDLEAILIEIDSVIYPSRLYKTSNERMK